MRMSEDNKPLPEITDLTKPFWQGALDGKLCMQECAQCNTVNFVPRGWCIECGSRDLKWKEQKPYGVVYSYTVAEIVTMNLPGWEKELPVISCLIDIEDGARMYGQLVSCDPEEVKVGMRVRAKFVSISDDIGIPVFEPIEK